MKIVNLCPVCGGSGKFLMQACGSCNGSGGIILKPNEAIKSFIEQNRAKLSEQETILLDFYKKGYSQKDIAKNMDLTPAKAALLLHRIEKKLTQ